MSQLQFTLDVRQGAQRRLGVSLDLDRAVLGSGAKDPGWQDFFLPTWTPGSYMIREYSRHLGRVEARDLDSGRLLTCQKTGKNRYRVTLTEELRRLRLTYPVYAQELSVRTSDLTAAHAYWNHATVLLWPVDTGPLAARITVKLPDDWDFACGLPVERNGNEVTLVAADHDEAVDTPCLAGPPRGAMPTEAAPPRGAMGPKHWRPGLTRRVPEDRRDDTLGIRGHDRHRRRCYRRPWLHAPDGAPWLARPKSAGRAARTRRRPYILRVPVSHLKA